MGNRNNKKTQNYILIENHPGNEALKLVLTKED
jgi:hypothetical protein